MKPFLTSEWRYLVNLTWRVDPSLLAPYLPPGVTLDVRDGAAFVSFVAFEFRHTRVRGLAVPFHVNFPEINLRFYVTCAGHRGVVFIRELVPRACIALVARRLYNEPYVATPMRSSALVEEAPLRRLRVEHRFGARYSHRMAVIAAPEPSLPAADSDAWYFKEHRWGFGRTRRGEALFYEVRHAEWPAYPVLEHQLDVDFGALYGREWAFLGDEAPFLRLLAEGSAVEVLPPRRLDEFAAWAGQGPRSVSIAG